MERLRGKTHRVSAKQRSCALCSSPPPNFFRASFNLTYLQLHPYMSALMSFQHRLILNTHHASAYDLILNVLDRYGSDASYVVIQSGSVYKVIIHSRSQSPRLIGLSSFVPPLPLTFSAPRLTPLIVTGKQIGRAHV